MVSGQGEHRPVLSEEYRRIMSKRENTVDSQAVIITAGEMYGDDRDKREGKMG